MTEYPHIREAEDFHGFGTVHFYESECRKAGQIVDRLPCTAADGTACVALLTRCPTGSPDSFDGLDIITADETHCLYSGAVRHSDIALTAELARLGYFFPGCGVNVADAVTRIGAKRICFGHLWELGHQVGPYAGRLSKPIIESALKKAHSAGFHPEVPMWGTRIA